MLRTSCGKDKMHFIVIKRERSATTCRDACMLNMLRSPPPPPPYYSHKWWNRGECEKLLKNLGEQLAKEEDKDYSDVMMGLRTMLSFQVLKADVLCVRGQGDHGLRTANIGPTSRNVPTNF